MNIRNLGIPGIDAGEDVNSFPLGGGRPLPDPPPFFRAVVKLASRPAHNRGFRVRLPTALFRLSGLSTPSPSRATSSRWGFRVPGVAENK